MALLKSFVVAFAMVTFLGGCTTRLVDFTAISTKNVKVPGGDAKGKRVSGEDCVWIVYMPLGVPNMKEAIDRAIESAGPEYDALIDGVVYQTQWWAFIGQMCFKVEGTPINTKKSVSMNEQDLKSAMYHSARHEDASVAVN